MKYQWNWKVVVLFLGVFLGNGFLWGEMNKFRLSWRDDPSTTMVIGWNQLSGSNSIVYYGPRDFGADYKKYPKKHLPDVARRYRGMHSHFARLTGLRPDSAYYFVIVDSDGASNRMWFKTAPARPKPFTLVGGGDTRTNAAPRRAGNKMIAKLRPLAVVHGGDYTDVGSDSDWDEWLDDWQLTQSEDGRMYPIVPTHGNHENRDMHMVYYLFDSVRPEMYYALNIGGNMMRLYILNTEIKDAALWDAQTTWLIEDLKANSHIKWKMASYHKPFRPHTSHKKEMLVQIEDWAQAFYDYGMDLAIECDTHMVKRTFPLRPSDEVGSYESFIRDDERGTVFIGEGSWGAPIRPTDDNKPWTLASASFWQFNWIHAYPEHWDIRTVRFEDSDQVDKIGSNTEKNVFGIPANIDLWKPPTGEVLRLPFDASRVPNLPEKEVVFIPRGAKWKFHDRGMDLGNQWREKVFDDGSWHEGIAQLGYGEGDEETLLSYGVDKHDKHVTYYFRRKFRVKDPEKVSFIRIDIVSDDGAVCFLNGQEVYRYNMPVEKKRRGKIVPGSGKIDYNTFAVNAVSESENEFHGRAFDPNALVAGENIIAVEVHQANPSSQDLSFDLRLYGMSR